MPKEIDRIDAKEKKIFFNSNKKINPFCGRRFTVKSCRGHIQKFLGRNNTTNFDQAILSQIDESKFPEWTKQLIEWEANPVDTRTMGEFCKDYGAHPQSIARIRQKYPGYWTAVKYKQREYLAELGNVAMKVLARRILVSDKALEIALTLTGEYTPTLKHQTTEELTTEDKRQRVENMLEELRKQQLITMTLGDSPGPSKGSPSPNSSVPPV